MIFCLSTLINCFFFFYMYKSKIVYDNTVIIFKCNQLGMYTIVSLYNIIRLYQSMSSCNNYV